jgi:formate hydrogenlyase subunit 3/multisubunit Na+/H+ antiporter MnhD subunit
MQFEFLLTVVCMLVALAMMIIPVLPAGLKSLTALGFIILNALITSIPAILVLAGAGFSFSFDGGASFGNIDVTLDPLSAWFVLIINITLVNGALYGTGYMKSYKNRSTDLSLHWIMFVLFHASMLMVCMLRNGFAFLIAWEIMTLSSLVLVLFDYVKANTLKAGLNYLVQMHIGVAFLTIAFIWVFVATGTAGFEGISSFLTENKGHWVVFLFFMGFGMKAGFVPLHTWLPYAHPAAPSHVSGVMSGVIVKTGISGMMRIALQISHDVTNTGVILLIISAITTLYGILNASVHRDFKKMLAFCTTENIGIIGMGIGLALVGKGINNNAMLVTGFGAALLHTLNHSLYKSLLFFSVGNVYTQTHTRNMEHLGGLIRTMPQTALLFLAGSLAIGGLPPLNGFVSKFLVYSGFIESFKLQDNLLSALMIICTVILSLAGGVSMLTFTKAFGIIFLGTPRVDYPHKPAEVPAIMRLPLYLIVAMMLMIGIFPGLVLTPVYTILQSQGTPLPALPLASISETLAWVGRASLLLLGLILLLYAIRRSFIRRTAAAPTWGCGYVAPHAAMQYTGKSYSKSLAKLFGFITMEDKKYNELKTASVFPSPRTYASFYLEFFETRIFDPVVKQFLRFFGFFSFIHNGKIQLYVLYGFFFVIVLIVLSFINIL